MENATSTIAPNISVEQLLVIISIMVAPSITGAWWLATRLSSLEAQMRAIKELKIFEHSVLVERMDKLEKSAEQTKEAVNTMNLILVRHGLDFGKAVEKK